MISIYTTPQVAIGQRAFLLCSPKGNILWDCITYIDEETIKRIKDLGGVKAIVISHPHYFSTSLHWGEALGCPVYLSSEDKEWLMRNDEGNQVFRFWEDKRLELLDGEFLAVKVGGHFPGSSVLLWKSEKKLFIADSITVIPSGGEFFFCGINPICLNIIKSSLANLYPVYHIDRPPNTASFAFMWSYPNMVSYFVNILSLSITH